MSSFEKLTVYELFPEFFLRIRMKEVEPLEANSVSPKFESFGIGIGSSIVVV